jgi:hypothetical protein
MFGRCNVGVAEPGRYRRLYVRYEENKNSDCSSLSSPAGAIVATMAATNKYLARSNKSHRGAKRPKTGTANERVSHRSSARRAEIAMDGRCLIGPMSGPRLLSRHRRFSEVLSFS